MQPNQKEFASCMMNFDCTDYQGHHFNKKVNNFINSTFQWTRTLSSDKISLYDSSNNIIF